MSQEELVFLIAVTVVMPIVALWIILNYQKARIKAKDPDADHALTTSELNALIDESVAEATAPLEERVSELESQLRLLGPGPSKTMQDELGALDETEGAETPSKTLGRTRS